MAILNIWLTFSILYDHLVQFVFICYSFIPIWVSCIKKNLATLVSGEWFSLITQLWSGAYLKGLTFPRDLRQLSRRPIKEEEDYATERTEIGQPKVEIASPKLKSLECKRCSFRGDHFNVLAGFFVAFRRAETELGLRGESGCGPIPKVRCGLGLSKSLSPIPIPTETSKSPSPKF
jgi:hypothetical protein